MSLKHLGRWAASLLVASTLGLSATSAAVAADPSVIRIVPQADLKILDPIWTTAFVTRNHGYMIYDTLFGVTQKGEVKPQMVDTYTVAPDNKTFTFTLRDGLKFHDGKPVTSDDVIASLKRWGARDNLGQKMFAAMDSITAVDAKTVKMSFKTPFGMVLEALSKPSSVPAFMMPKSVAMTPPDQQITDTTGSGPYMLVKDEFRPGERVVYAKFKDYKPRNEEPDGTAGGKRVYVDRVEWVILKDAQTQANALANGEVDLIEWLPAEQYSGLKANPNIKLEDQVGKMQVMLHLNHLVPPFNNPKLARAALMAINQEALMRAQLVHKELYSTCPSIYVCGSMYASNNTSFFTGKPQFAKAKELLKEAGYDGSPVVFLYPADFALINKYPPVMAELLKQAGFNVELASMDWPTLVTRRTKKDPPTQGGWSAFITGWGNADTMNPLFFAPLTGSGEKGWFGWTTDQKLEDLKSQFLVTTDPAERKKIAEQIQISALESAVYGPVGEFKQLAAYRSNISGLVHAPIPVFWNLKKN